MAVDASSRVESGRDSRKDASQWYGLHLQQGDGDGDNAGGDAGAKRREEFGKRRREIVEEKKGKSVC